MATEVLSPPPVARSAGPSHAQTALWGLAGSAGIIHLVASVEHFTTAEWTFALFFVVVGAGQLLAAWLMHRDPHDVRLLKLVAAASVGVAMLWILSRTTGVPVGPDAGEVAAVGVADTIATLQELSLAALAVTVLRRGERSVAWLSSPIGSRLTFALLSMTLMLAVLGGHEH